MKRYEPIPREEGLVFVHRLAGKSLQEIIAMFGPPKREHGVSPRYGQLPDQTVGEVGHYTKTFEYADVTRSIKTFLVRVRDDGQLEFEFRGRELVETKA